MCPNNIASKEEEQIRKIIVSKEALVVYRKYTLKGR